MEITILKANHELVKTLILGTAKFLGNRQHFLWVHRRIKNPRKLVRKTQEARKFTYCRFVIYKLCKCPSNMTNGLLYQSTHRDCVLVLSLRPNSTSTIKESLGKTVFNTCDQVLFSLHSSYDT